MNGGGHSTGAGKRVLVTGGTGFIGGRIVGALLASGATVRVLVRERARARALGRVEVFEGDLCDPEGLAGVEEGVDSVVHCASLLGKWGTDDRLIHAVNVEGSLNVLGRFAGHPLDRYLHLSAGGVTGPARETVVDETYECKPATPYEKTKLLAERAVLDRSRELGIPAAVVRPTFTYGPGDPHKLALFRAVKKGRYAFIDGGRSVNHPVFIDDLVDGLLLALEHARVGEVYIVGGERPVSKRELVEAIADALGVSRPRLSLPKGFAGPVASCLELLGRALRFEPILTRSRVMMMADNFGYSIAKARRELHYAPKTGLTEGIRRTVESYIERGLL